VNVFTFPESLYGPTAAVRTSVRRFATEILRSESAESVLRGPHIDVASYPGRVVLERGRLAPVAAERNFHADLLWSELSKSVFKKFNGEDAFTRLRALAALGMGEAWWFVGLSSSQSYYLVRRASLQLKFLEYALQHWETLLSIGSRYFPFAALETTPTLVSFCLARQGAPIKKEPFRALTGSRLKELIDDLPGERMRALVVRGDFTEAARVLAGHGDIPALSLAEHLLDVGQDALACQLVRELNLPDPHGIVAEWLAGEGNPERNVR